MIQAPSDRQEIRPWPRAPLKGVVNFRSGYRNSDTAVADGEFPFFVCSNEVLRSNEFDFDDEAVVMAGNNADGVFHLHHFNGKFAARQRTYVITPSTKRLDCRYLFYQLGVLQRSFQAAAIGTTTRYVTIEMLRGAEIPLPELAIQRPIAAALSNADALIESLEQLLAKKRQLKQGAMQELLTGKRRLPGFSGDWEVKLKRLGELAEIRSGGTPSTTQSQFWDGDVLWCTPTDITRLNGFKYLSDTGRKISQAGLKFSSAEIIPANSVVMTSRATIGECAINRVPVSTNQGFKNFTPFESVDVGFLYYLLLTKKQGFVSLCGGSTFLEVGKAQLASFEVRVPTTKAEQTAIADILSDIDEEIAALQAKLAKARNIKQGMMQELLTGRIRLV